jgi:hypothetical protein
VQALPQPGLTAPAAPLPRAALTVLAALAAAAAAASFVLPAPAERAPAQRAAIAAGGVTTGVPLQQASCTDWWRLTGDQRNALFGALRGSVGGMTPYGPGTTLTDAEATRLFDNACANPVASGFLLYALYVRAAGFRSAAAP